MGTGFVALSTIVAIGFVVLAVMAAVGLGRAMPRVDSGPLEPTPSRPRRTRWYEVLLAAALLAILIGLGAWLAIERAAVWETPVTAPSIPVPATDRPAADGSAADGASAPTTPRADSSGDSSTGAAAGTATDWRESNRGSWFIVLMLAGGGLSLVCFVAFLIARWPRVEAAAATGAAGAVAAARPGEITESPSPIRLLGLALLAVAFLLLGWIHLAPDEQHRLMADTLYPAALAVALVLLFDKATRTWTPKTGAESFREWLLCDLLVLILVLGLVNVRGIAGAESYPAFFFDMLHVTGFFFVFWLLDRKHARARFLVAYVYLALLPLLLLVWRRVQGIEPAEGLSWWSTVWPVFLATALFGLLEIVALVGQRESRSHALPAVKDALFVAVYAVLLIAASPSGE